MRDSEFLNCLRDRWEDADIFQNRIILRLAAKHLLESTTFMQDGAPLHIARSFAQVFWWWSLAEPPLSLCLASQDSRSESLWLLALGLSEVASLPRLTDINRDAKREHQTHIFHHTFKHAVQCCSQHCPSTTATIEEWWSTCWAFFWRTSSLLFHNLSY